MYMHVCQTYCVTCHICGASHACCGCWDVVLQMWMSLKHVYLYRGGHAWLRELKNTCQCPQLWKRQLCWPRCHFHVIEMITQWCVIIFSISCSMGIYEHEPLSWVQESVVCCFSYINITTLNTCTMMVCEVENLRKVNLDIVSSS